MRAPFCPVSAKTIHGDSSLALAMEMCDDAACGITERVLEAMLLHPPTPEAAAAVAVMGRA